MTNADGAGLVQPILPSPLTEERHTLYRTLTAKATEYHDKVPGIRKLPFPAVAIIVMLIVVNICVWIAAGIVLVYFFIQLK